MKVVFDGKYFGAVLTENKIYDAIERPNFIYGPRYEIICDDGMSRMFYTHSFITLNELRKEKLKRLMK